FIPTQLSSETLRADLPRKSESGTIFCHPTSPCFRTATTNFNRCPVVAQNLCSRPSCRASRSPSRTFIFPRCSTARSTRESDIPKGSHENSQFFPHLNCHRGEHASCG